MFKSRNIISLSMALLFSATAFAASEDKLDHDNSILSVFVQPSISFISFSEREYFQNAIDTIYKGFKETAVSSAESLNVAKQDFQKVNFCFPITAGIQWQPKEDHFISAGIGFIYDNESVVLTDRKSHTHSYEYTLQGIPFFLEYRFALPKNFITLSDGGLFSVSVRWYWMLPGTEIYTTWGYLAAERSLFGAGFGVSVGYLFASWKDFKLYGDIGFSSISVKSNKKFSQIVQNGPDEKANWNLGGIQLQIRGTFGLWNKPKPKDDDDDDDDGEGKKPKVKFIDDTKKDSVKVDAQDSAKTDTGVVQDSSAAQGSLSATQDSAKIDTSAAQDSAGIADSPKTSVQDSIGTAPASNAPAKQLENAASSAPENAPAPQDAPQKSADPANVKSKGD